jgi:hypothetical protein
VDVGIAALRIAQSDVRDVSRQKRTSAPTDRCEQLVDVAMTREVRGGFAQGRQSSRPPAIVGARRLDLLGIPSKLGDAGAVDIVSSRQKLGDAVLDVVLGRFGREKGQYLALGGS